MDDGEPARRDVDDSLMARILHCASFSRSGRWRLICITQVPTPAPWTPPELGGPLPSELLTRAQTLLQRQQQMIARTTDTMTGARKNRALLGKVADVTGVRRPAQAVYLDVRA